MVKIKLNESQLNKLFEYHSQQRLPFKDKYGIKDYEFADKNMAEEYLDWIEEFGKVGELDSSSISFVDGFKSGLSTAFKWYTDKNSSVDNKELKIKFTKGLKRHGFIVINDDKSIGTDCKFNDKGNMYVERAIVLDNDLSDPSSGMFDKLVNDYQNNIGGCWCWAEGGTIAYCERNQGSKILLRGWIRLDDINWDETVYLNSYHMNGEREIRVKPNAKVELFEILGTYDYNHNFYYNDEKNSIVAYDDEVGDCDFYKFDLGGRHIIVNATYLGDNGKYNEERFAEIYDYSSKDKKFMDREGNILNSQKELIMKKIERLRSNSDMSYLDIFNGVREVQGSEFLLCNDYGKWFILNDNDDSLVGGMIFDSADIVTLGDYNAIRVRLSENSNEYMSDYKVNYIKMNGEYMFKDWYDSIFTIDGKTFFVELNDKYGLYNNSGEIKFIFDDVNRLVKCEDRSLSKYYIEVTYKDKCNLYDVTDKRFVTNHWFDEGYWISYMEDIGNVIATEDENGNELYINLLSGKIINI